MSIYQTVWLFFRRTPLAGIYLFFGIFIVTRLNRICSSLSLVFFSIISVLVASLGLFDLFWFVSRESNREVTIRKVCGSSSIRILWLFAKRYLIILLVANVISIPIAFYFMNQWLQNYSYSTNIGVLIFLLS
ncbi:MAG: FtsX-like permease family protein [Bacteroidetes bacterium]|nr:FtsX-like permease family protein [Bacteroidota bacterium]